MTTAPALDATTYRSALLRVALAAEHMYDAEVALHIARQSDLDMWVRAASAKLHDAIVEHNQAMAGRDALLGTPVRHAA